MLAEIFFCRKNNVMTEKMIIDPAKNSREISQFCKKSEQLSVLRTCPITNQVSRSGMAPKLGNTTRVMLLSSISTPLFRTKPFARNW